MDRVAERQGCGPVPYFRRHPETTSLYRAVQQHLETYLALAGEEDWDGQRVPVYVEREFRRDLECGSLAYDFARARCPACGHAFLVAFSCKGRGVCPSCNALRMAETAAHLVDRVFPPLPVRQWVLSVPKRMRWYLEREPKAVTAVLHIFLRVVEAHLRRCCPGASARARFGAVSFVHRFGAWLNRHLHYHCCILDGVFEPLEGGGVQFRQASALTPETVATIEAQVRRRVLRWFSRHGLLDPEDAGDMLARDNSGFSLDASVRIAGHDRPGLERLLRYCACPPFALERIEQVNEERIVYRLLKPQRDGRTALYLTPRELIDHLVALIPPPRLHRHRYHGVLAPNAPLRLAATAYARDADPDLIHPPPVAASPPPSPPAAAAPSGRSPARYPWALLIARLFLTLPLVCPNCGADMRIVAFSTEAAPVRRILLALGEPAEPPRIGPARGPPSSTRKCNGSLLPSSPPTSDLPLPAPRSRQTTPHAPSAPSERATSPRSSPRRRPRRTCRGLPRPSRRCYVPAGFSRPCGWISYPFWAFMTNIAHAQAPHPGATAQNVVYPGESIIEVAGYPALVKFEPGAAKALLVVFITGGGVLARVAYGHPEGRSADFLAHWLKQEGTPFLAISYPIGHPVFAKAYPDFSMTDWGEQSAEIVARHVKAHDLPARVVVLGWSMAGRIAQPIAASLRKRGIEIELFVAMAAATALPNLLPGLATVKPQPSGLAGVAGGYTDALLLNVRERNAETGHTVIDPAIFPAQFMGDYPIRLAAAALKFENSAFMPDPLGDQDGTGAWRYASFPPLALLTHEAAADARHALMDRSTWGFYISQNLSETHVFARVKNLLKLPPDRWRRINDLVHGAPARLTIVMQGNHMFFVGETGAKATVAALKDLRGRAVALDAELDAATKE